MTQIQTQTHTAGDVTTRGELRLIAPAMTPEQTERMAFNLRNSFDSDFVLANKAFALTVYAEAYAMASPASGAPAAVPEEVPPAPTADIGMKELRDTLKELTEAADEMIAFVPGHWHDDHTIRLTDAAEDANKVLKAAEQDDLYETSPRTLAAAPAAPPADGGTGGLHQALAQVWREGAVRCSDRVKQLGPRDPSQFGLGYSRGYIDAIEAIEASAALSSRTPARAETKRYPYSEPKAWPNWSCPDCRCKDFARVDEQKPDKSFGPGPLIRCVNCKNVFDTRTPAGAAGDLMERERVARIIARMSGRGIGYKETDDLDQWVEEHWYDYFWDLDQIIGTKSFKSEDAERLNWLEQAAKKSRTGISFDHIPSVDGEASGFRFMRRFFVGEARKSLRSAIDAARGEVEQMERRDALATRPASPAPAGAAGDPVGAPQGWRLVPRVPTEQMLETGRREYHRVAAEAGGAGERADKRRWFAMLDASPEPPPATRPASPAPAASAGGAPSFGWLFHNPDTGVEWSASHPVESGECEDATDIRPATLEHLYDEMIGAWALLAEYRDQRERASPAPAAQVNPGREALKLALKVWHQNTCYPTASDGELEIGADAILAARPVAEGDAETLTLTALHQANIVRQAEWCAGGDPEPDLAFRGVELAGETGEALNVIKKLERERRGWRGSRAVMNDLAEELADVVICADLCAVSAGIDLGAAVVAKFNATSAKVGLTTMLPAARPAPSPTKGGTV